MFCMFDVRFSIQCLPPVAISIHWVFYGLKVRVRFAAHVTLRCSYGSFSRWFTVRWECACVITVNETWAGFEFSVIAPPPQQGAARPFPAGDYAACWRCWVAALAAGRATAVKPYWDSVPWGREKQWWTSCVCPSGISGKPNTAVISGWVFSNIIIFF